MKAAEGESREILLRAIPSVDGLLHRPLIEKLTERMDRAVVRDRLRSVLDDLRSEIVSGQWFDGAEGLIAEVERRLEREAALAEKPSLRPVINATGVVVHTNLGRSPLSDDAVAAIAEIARGYSNLEYDLARGERGRREVHCEQLLMEMLGCEAAVVVNNNAAATLLVLNTLAEGGEVIVSRGELIEIGGSFRIPDIMARSGAILREVGTTNRTRLADYEQAINERTRLLLRVHPSNFRVIGFTERPTLEELIELSRQRGLPCYEDLGSGCLVDVSRWGIKDEPVVQASLQAGVDVCSSSGDKLLGGPQAGVIVGKKEIVSRVRRNPLMRAIRPDKLTYAALEATLRAYRRGVAERDVPTLRMLGQPADEIRRRARRFVRQVKRALGDRVTVQLIAGTSVVGGGAAPDSQLDTVLIAVGISGLSAAELEERLRRCDPPIISRIESDRVVLDLRTVRPDEERIILNAFCQVAGIGRR
jgi:L-seryl-tRNA(Ser) seleniumtransferase